MPTASGRTARHRGLPPPLSTKVLRCPPRRGTRRSRARTNAGRCPHQNSPLLLLMHQKNQSPKATLGDLFGRENEDPPVTRGPVPSVSNSESPGRKQACAARFAEEKWRSRAGMLRAECKLLLMEKGFALKKEKNKVKMERTVKLPDQTFVTETEKIVEGKNVNPIISEEMGDSAEKLEDLQKNSRELQNRFNFDKKACLLQRKFENLRGLSYQNYRKDSLQSNLCVDVDEESKISNWKMEDMSSNVEMLREKIEGLSKESVMARENKCTGRCRSIVRRIVEQVRDETDQWAQVQEMLAQVRREMEDLQASRDFWENRAHGLDHEVRSLRHTVEEWKEKAIGYENKANELRLEISTLKEQTQNPSLDLSRPPPVPLRMQLEKEKNLETDGKEQKYENAPDEEFKTGESTSRKKGLPMPLSLSKQLEKEKRKFLRHSMKKKKKMKNHSRVHDDNDGDRERGSEREVPVIGRRRMSCSTVFGILETSHSHFIDISSLSPLTRQISRSAFFGFRSPES